MRESVGKSQSMTESMISIFGSFDHRLSTLEHAMRPTQVLLLPILNPPTIIEHRYVENYFCGTTPLCVQFAQYFLERQSWCRHRRTCLRNCTCSSYWTFKCGYLRLTLSKLEPNEFECGLANRFSISLQTLPFVLLFMLYHLYNVHYFLRGFRYEDMGILM